MNRLVVSLFLFFVSNTCFAQGAVTEINKPFGELLTSNILSKSIYN